MITALVAVSSPVMLPVSKHSNYRLVRIATLHRQRQPCDSGEKQMNYRLSCPIGRLVLLDHAVRDGYFEIKNALYSEAKLLGTCC